MRKITTGIEEGSQDPFHQQSKPGRYILAVARFVPEKGLHDLIRAFKGLGCDYKLVIAGEADHETDYSKKLRRMAF